MIVFVQNGIAYQFKQMPHNIVLPIQFFLTISNMSSLSRTSIKIKIVLIYIFFANLIHKPSFRCGLLAFKYRT